MRASSTPVWIETRVHIVIFPRLRANSHLPHEERTARGDMTNDQSATQPLSDDPIRLSRL
jgi:hypothetical protein